MSATNDEAGLEGRPLETLFESYAPPPFDLPSPLVQAYGGPLGFDAPRVIANFVTSVDGVVGLEGGAESGGIVSGGDAGDHFVMGLLRACADAVVVGAGTYRKAARDLFVPEAIHPAAATLFAETRARLGLAQRPRFVLVTGSGAVDATGPALDGALIATTDRGAAALRGRLPPSAEVVSFGATSLRVADVVARLRTEGARVILTEGGPTLFAELVRDRAVDELFLTTSPRLFGRPTKTASGKDDERRGLTQGIDLGGRPLDLWSLRRRGAYLFSRYALR